VKSPRLYSFGRVLGPAAIAWCAVTLAHPQPVSATPPADIEAARVKAAILAKLPEFIDWPSQAVQGRSTFDVCVAQPDPFGKDLTDLVAGAIEEHPAAVRVVAHDADADLCQVLFIPPARSGGRALLARVAAKPVLTVGDAPSFLNDGGIINFRIVDGRVRFEVNVDAAQRAGLRISSQLLRLAVAVRETAR
jgi:hypothetical protein